MTHAHRGGHRRALVLFIVVAALAIAAPGRAAVYPLHVGSHGQPVKDLQWVLAGHAPAAYRFALYKDKIDGRFEDGTARALKSTKWRLGYPLHSARQAVAGKLFFLVIEHKVQRPFAWRIAAGRRANRAVPWPRIIPTPPKAVTLVRDAEYLIAHAGSVYYSQVNRMQIVRQRLRLPPLTRAISEDCSSSVTGLYWLAGLQDPNGRIGGRFYSGYGFTGTLSQHGRVVWRLGQSLLRLKPGDLIFYGRGTFSHVTMYLSRGRVFSLGSSAGPFNTPALYRGDAYYARRYFT